MLLLVLSTPYPGALSLPRTGQMPISPSDSTISPQPSAPGVVPTFAPQSRQPMHLSATSPWPPTGTGWVNPGGAPTHRTASSMGPVIPNFPLPSRRRRSSRNKRESTGESSEHSDTSVSSHSSDRNRRSKRNPIPAPPRDIAKDRARELHEAEQAVNAAKKVREATHAQAVAMAESEAFRRAGIQVAPIPNTSAVALSSQASILPGVQYSAPFASSSSHLGHGQPMHDPSVPMRHNSQPVFTYGNIGNSKRSKGLSALFKRKSAPPKPLLKDVFPQPRAIAPSTWNSYSLVPPPVQDPSKPLILLAGVPPPDGYQPVAFGPVQPPQQVPAPNIPNIPMPPETTDVPVDADPVIPNLHKSGSGSRHPNHTRKPTLLDAAGINPTIADPVQYLPAGANVPMANVAHSTETGGIVGGQHIPWPGDFEWAERPKKRSLLDHIKDWTNGTELSSHPDPITSKAVFHNVGTHPPVMDLMKRKRSQSKERLDLLGGYDEPVDHRQASYDQLTGERPSTSFATAGGGGSGGRSKLKAVYFSERRGHELYPFCLGSEHAISWGGVTGATALHWYESGKFENARYGLGTDGMENGARPSEWVKNKAATRGLMRSLLGNAEKERTRKEAIELTRAATNESRDLLAALDIDTLTSLSNQFKSQGKERSDWDLVWKPKVRSIQLLVPRH